MNRILEKFQKHELSIGTFTHLKSATAVECLGRTGLDYVVIDTEHCGVGVDALSAAITAADAAGITPLVRINEISRSAVLQPLDAGAKGLLVPAVVSVEQVRRLVEYAKFPPLGKRGFCPTRDGGWGFDDASARGVGAYMARCDRETLLIPQCETAECLAQIEEIAAISGVDGIFVGPLDLSISLGCPMQFDQPVMLDALARILSACRTNGKLTIIFCGDTETARLRASQGYDSLTVGLDTQLLIHSCREMVGAIRA